VVLEYHIVPWYVLVRTYVRTRVRTYNVMSQLSDGKRAQMCTENVRTYTVYVRVYVRTYVRPYVRTYTCTYHGYQVPRGPNIQKHLTLRCNGELEYVRTYHVRTYVHTMVRTRVRTRVRTYHGTMVSTRVLLRAYVHVYVHVRT
jgi:hypothetical protein